MIQCVYGHAVFDGSVVVSQDNKKWIWGTDDRLAGVSMECWWRDNMQVKTEVINFARKVRGIVMRLQMVKMSCGFTDHK